MGHRFTPENIPPPPPFAPGRGAPAMDQLPHDFAAAARTQIIEPPPQHRNSIPSPGWEDDRRGSYNSGKDLVAYEGYTVTREPALRGEKSTWAVSKRTQWKAKDSELKEIVKKQQKRGLSAYIPINVNSDIKNNKRGQVDRLLHDRNNDRLNHGFQYELAALKIEGFQTRSGHDEKLKVILRRRMRPGVPRDPHHPIFAPPPYAPTEIIDLTLSDDYERSSQSSYPTPPPHLHGHGAFPFPAQPQPVHHGGHPDPQVFDDRFHPQPFGSPIGEEQRHPPHREPIITDQQFDNFGDFGGRGKNGKEDKPKDESKDKSNGKQNQKHDVSDSSSASDNDDWSFASDATPITISSSRSNYGGDKKSFHASPQRKSSMHSHDDRDRGFKEENIYVKESHRPGPSGHHDESRGRSFKEEKTYHQNSHKAGSKGHDHEYHGGSSKKEKDYYPDIHQRRSMSADRFDARGRNDKKEKKYHHESRRNSRSHERSERSYKGEKSYHPDNRSGKSDRYGHEYRLIATREHVRKAPLARSRGSLSDGSSVYTDEEYIVVPQRGSRRHQPTPRSFYHEAPVRPRRVILDNEEPFDCTPRGLGRSNTMTYRPKLTNRAFRPVDLHDNRLDYAREQAELQRQRDFEIQREEEEDRMVQQEVRKQLAREDEELMIQHQRRTEIAREESRRRIAAKVREEVERARLSRERPYDAYEPSLLGRRASGAYPY